MKKLLILTLLTAVSFFGKIEKAEACHAIALVNFNQMNYVPGVGLQLTADSDSPTCGCGAYWLDVEIRCDSNAMDGSGLTAGNWTANGCFPYYQSAQMMKPNCIVQTYPTVTIPDSVMCPGMTYTYRLRENHNGAVGPWTPIMQFTMPGTLVPFTPGTLTLTANPQSFCGSTQLGWNYTPGTGCGSGGGCSTDTSYQWYVISGEPINVPVNFSCDTCPYPIASPSIQTTYGLTITVGDTNACGYGVSTLIPITVTPLSPPIAGTVTGSLDCMTGDFSLNESGSFGTIEWQESFDNGATWTGTGNTSSSHFVPNAPPNSCYQISVTTQCGTVTSNMVCALGSGQLTADFSNSSACEGASTQFTDLSNSSGGAIQSWAWDFGDGSAINNSQNPIHSYAAAGQYSVTLTVTSASGCTSQFTKIVETDPSPNAAFGLTDICAGNSANFTDQSTISAGTINAWNWNLGGVANSNVQNPNQNFSNSDLYTIELIVTSDKGCTDTVTNTLTVSPNPVVDFTSNDICFDQGPSVFNNLTTISSGSIANWDWSFGDGNSSNIQSPTNAYGQYGSYNVKLIATSDMGCVDSSEITLNIHETPSAKFGPINIEACGDICVTFIDETILASSSINSYAWDFGNGNTSTDVSPTECFNYTEYVVPQYFNVSLTVTSAEGCTNSITVPNTVTLYEQPVAQFTPTPAVTNEYNANIDFDNTSTGATAYSWDFGDGATSTQFEPDHLYTDTGLYVVTLIASTQYGCADTATNNVIITAEPSCNLPNAFSPNGDGLNDEFGAVLYGYKDYEFNFQIFDRDGHLVFETDQVDNKWDGSVNKQASNFDPKTDIYIWKVSIIEKNNGRRDQFTGHVTILR